MTTLRFVVFVIVFVKSTLCITGNSQKDTAEILWKLSNFAVESRQNFGKNPHQYSNKYQHYPNNYLNEYPLYQHKPYYQLPETYHGKYPYFPKPFGTNYITPKQSIMDVLDSVARNDDLRCVPRIICEVTSGTISGRQQGLNLPVNINMDSLLGFLSVINGVQSNPLLYFAQAALLGYTSKGNSKSCSYTYPECPSDPDKLVLYLNNHNGGFFRFFNGINPSNYNYRPVLAQQRIQNKPAEYTSNYDVKFPSEDLELLSNFEFSDHRQQKGLTFPTEEIITQNDDGFIFRKPKDSLKFPPEENYNEDIFRKPKELYNVNFYQPENELDLQKPLPNHQASPIIFPVRTGTGELILDNEEFDGKNFAFQNDVKITFNGFNNFVKNMGNYRNSVSSDLKLNRNGREIKFPSV